MPIEILPESSGNALGVRARGKLTAADYEDVWIPRLEQIIAAHGSVRVLLYMGADFDGWDLEAAWDDAKFGFRHGSDCEKIAVVGGPKWVEWGSNLVGRFLKGELQTFGDDELAAAWDWLTA